VRGVRGTAYIDIVKPVGELPVQVIFVLEPNFHTI